MYKNTCTGLTNWSIIYSYQQLQITTKYYILANYKIGYCISTIMVKVTLKLLTEISIIVHWFLVHYHTVCWSNHASFLNNNVMIWILQPYGFEEIRD